MFGCTTETNIIDSHMDSEDYYEDLKELKRKYVRISELLAETECKRCEDRRIFEKQMNDRVLEEEKTLLEMNGRHVIELTQLEETKNFEILELKKAVSSLTQLKEKYDAQIATLVNTINSHNIGIQNLKDYHQQNISQLQRQYEDEKFKI